VRRKGEHGDQRRRLTRTSRRAKINSTEEKKHRRKEKIREDKSEGGKKKLCKSMTFMDILYCKERGVLSIIERGGQGYKRTGSVRHTATRGGWGMKVRERSVRGGDYRKSNNKLWTLEEQTKTGTSDGWPEKVKKEGVKGGTLLKVEANLSWQEGDFELVQTKKSNER